MKKYMFASAAALSALASGVMAGTVAYVAPEVPVVVEETGGSMGGSGLWLIPLIAIALIALAMSNNNPPINISDRRLKRDIKRVGMSEIGLPLYEFKYILGTKTHVGVMAQDVLEHTPEAVVRSPLGYYKVDYGMLGLEMTTVN